MNILESRIQREWLCCPACGEWVHTKPAEGVPAQSLRACNDCEAVFYMDLDSEPIFAQPEAAE